MLSYLKEQCRDTIIHEIYLKYLYPYVARYRTPKLYRVFIEPTNACNLKCQVCYSQRPDIFPARPKGFMEFSLYRKIIDEVSTYGHKINLGMNFGGESLLHKEFLEMLAYASAKKVFHMGFTTNGALLTDEAIKCLIENEVNELTFSLDGMEGDHEKFRTGSEYGKVEENILKLVKERGAKSFPKISVNLTHSTQSDEEVLRFAKAWVKVVDSVRVYPCYTEDLRVINRKFFEETPYFGKGKYCYWPFNYMAILWNGDVVTCCPDINGVNLLGNVVNKSVYDVWKGKKYQMLRYQSVRNNFPKNSICGSCDTWKYRFREGEEEVEDLHVKYSFYGKEYRPKGREALPGIE